MQNYFVNCLALCIDFHGKDILEFVFNTNNCNNNLYLYRITCSAKKLLSMKVLLNLRTRILRK